MTPVVNRLKTTASPLTRQYSSKSYSFVAAKAISLQKKT